MKLFATLFFGAMALVRTSAETASTTTVSDVRALQLTSGGKAAVSYMVTHDILGVVAPGAPLSGARIARAQYPDAYAGVWGADYGGLGAWLSPPSDILPHAQFSPISRLIENTYFTNRLTDSSEASALAAGDRAQLAMADTIANAPLPWDRQRGTANGTLAWDYAVDYRQVSATYNGVSGTTDVIFIRADLVARGGDVDARAGLIPAPPLVIDLPRIYLNRQSVNYLRATLHPYTAYSTSPVGSLKVYPETGKAVLTSFAQGYLYEAKEYTLPGGGEVKEWHIPIQAIILLTPDGSTGNPLLSHATARMPQGGIAVADDQGVARRLEVPPGSTVQAEVGMPPQVVDDRGNIVAPLKVAAAVSAETPASAFPVSVAQASASSTPTGSSVIIDELKALAPINSSLSSPVDLLVGNQTYGLTIDPDFRGEGVLALRSVRRAATGTQYANVIANPYAIVDGAPIKLERSRLLDLRVVPVYKGLTATWVGQNFDPLPRTHYVQGTVFPFGLDVEAVYDLGNDRYAFLELVAKPQVNSVSYVQSNIAVRSINGERVASAPVQYVELPEVGPVSYGGVTRTTEFSGSVDLLSTGDNKTLTVGNHILAPSILQFQPRVDGILTVLQAPAPLTPNPAPDPAKSIEGQPLAFYYTPPPGTTSQLSLMNIDIVADGPPPTPNPGAIGQQCGTPQIVDGPAPDAAPDQDIKSAWLDADDANLYATIQVGNVPAAAPAGNTYSWSLHWRYEHGGRYGRATLDSAGQWKFDFGFFNGRFSELNDITGDVQAGANGFIRIWVPRNLLGYRNGELLRDTSAHSWVDVYTTDVVDRAPDGTNATYGSGGDYIVGPSCLPGPVQLAAVVSRKTHGSRGPFDVGVPLTGDRGIECRRGGGDGAHTLIFIFANELVSVGGSSATATQEGGGNRPVAASGSINPADRKEYIVNLTGVPNAQVLTVNLANVNDSAGNSSASVSASMGVLLGDVNGSRVVDGNDVSSVQSKTRQVADSTNFKRDVNVSGSIDGNDVSLTQSKTRTRLP